MRANLRVLLAAIRLTIQDYMAQPAWLFWLSITPFAFAIVASFLYKGTSQETFLLYVVLGAGAMGMWASVLGGAGYSMMWERRWGTVAYSFITPASQLWIAAGKSLVNTVVGLLTVIEILILTVMFYGIERISIASPVAFLSALLLTFLNFAVIGLFLNGFFMLTRSASNWQNALTRFLYVFCGAMYPIAVLPTWMLPISYILPPTWSLQAVRFAALETGALNSSFYLNRIGLSILLTILYVILAMYLQVVIEHRLRVSAELERI